MKGLAEEPNCDITLPSMGSEHTIMSTLQIHTPAPVVFPMECFPTRSMGPYRYLHLLLLFGEICLETESGVDFGVCCLGDPKKTMKS